MRQETNGLLYPAMHKFYSALRSIEQFHIGNDFFSNISSLDNFFSEYRNVTFVLKKSLTHSDYSNLYEKYREKFLANETSKWFVDKRNEVLKEHPFCLEKRVRITIFSPQNFIALPEFIFTIENDAKISSIKESLKRTFFHISSLEVFFSVEFSFYEKGFYENELYDELMCGINNMWLFLLAIKNEIKENCKLCDQLQQKIEGFKFNKIPKNMLFIDDYVYYCKKDKFEKAERTEFFVSHNSTKAPLNSFCDFLKIGTGEKRDVFRAFIKMYLVIFSKQRSIMPTFMIIYKNDTFEFKTFQSSIKTTLYRKINEIVRKIETEKIVSETVK